MSADEILSEIKILQALVSPPWLGFEPETIAAAEEVLAELIDTHLELVGSAPGGDAEIF